MLGIPKRWLKVGTAILGSAALVLVLFLGGGLLFPRSWLADATVVIAAPPDSVFRYLETPRLWAEWTPSPGGVVELLGREVGVGAGRGWDDPVYGSGSFMILEVQPGRCVVYRVDVEDGDIVIYGDLSLWPGEEATAVQWSEQGDFGWNPLLRYLTRRMGETQSEQLAASLERLKRLMEEGGGQ